MIASGKKWIVLTDGDGQPRLLLNSQAFLRYLMILGQNVAPSDYCHIPAVVTVATDTLDDALRLLAAKRERGTGHDEAVILLWSPQEKRMITGSDVLRCLLSGMGHLATGTPAS